MKKTKEELLKMSKEELLKCRDNLSKQSKENSNWTIEEAEDSFELLWRKL